MMRHQALEAFEQHSISSHQRFFLRACPPFQLSLSGMRSVDCVVALGVDDTDGSPGSGVPAAATLVVVGLTVPEIRCAAHIQTAVGTAEDVHPLHPTTMPSSDRLNKSGIEIGRAPFDSAFGLAPFDSRFALAQGRQGIRRGLWPAFR